MFQRVRDFDLYRKIPKDLTETTTHGTVLSVCASIFMITLFVAELWAFLSVQCVTNIVIDPSPDSLLRINFNVTVYDLPCEFAVIDVVDVLGTRENNVSKNIHKWQVDSQGRRRLYEGKNVEQEYILHDIHHDAEKLKNNGLHAIPLTEEAFETHLKANEVTFADFYAPWCIWCQRLEPVWEAFAERVELDEISVSVVKIDCVANANLCMNQKIQAYPMLRLFKGNVAQPPDFRADRTVDALMGFLEDRLALHKKVESMNEKELEAHLEEKEQIRDDHPGCMLTGFLLVNRVPGNFHIEARSKHHNLDPKMANLSHVVNSLSFGSAIPERYNALLQVIPKDLFTQDSITPMDGKYFQSEGPHQTSHHYIKVVSTQLEVSARLSGKNALTAYQMVQSSQTMMYGEDDIPEARFTYDISPMAVVISRKGKRWYEFVTSICALIGGTFTVVGLLSGFLNIIFKPKKL